MFAVEGSSDFLSTVQGLFIHEGNNALCEETLSSHTDFTRATDPIPGVLELSPVGCLPSWANQAQPGAVTPGQFTPV